MNLPLLSLLVLGGVLRFYAIGAKTIWLDEAFSIWMARHSLSEIFSWLVRIDQHPPLYYGLLHFWLWLFGDLQGVVRSFSALCSTLALPFFYGAGRRFLDKPTALLAILLLAVAPLHVRYAQEARMYALLTLTVAMTLYFLARLLFDQPLRHAVWQWLGLAVVQAAVMLTHNTATVLFPLALNLAMGGALVWKWKTGSDSSLPALNAPEFVRRWFYGQGLAWLLWAPWSIPFLLQARMVDGEFWIQPPTAGDLLDTFHNFHLAHLPADWVPFFHGWDWFYWGAALVGIYALRRTPARTLLLLSFLLTPMLGELLVSLRRPIFSERTLIWVTLPYYLLIAIGIRALNSLVKKRQGDRERGRQGEGETARPGDRETARTRGSPCLLVSLSPCLPVSLYFSRVDSVTTSILLVMLTLSGIALQNYYQNFQKEEWAAAAAYVAQQAAPGDLLLFNATWVQLPFVYYYRHYQTDTELRGLPVDLFDRGVLEPKMSQADLPYMRNLLAGRPRVWLVYSHDWYTDPQGLIPKELADLFQKVEQRQFVGLQVMRYEK